MHTEKSIPRNQKVVGSRYSSTYEGKKKLSKEEEENKVIFSVCVIPFVLMNSLVQGLTIEEHNKITYQSIIYV